MKPVLIFDTSGINCIISEQFASTPLLPAIQSAYHIRLTSTSVEEVLADPNRERRARLLDTCRTLMRDGDVVLPFHELISRHFLAFQNDRFFDWQRVPLEARDYRREIAFRERITDELSEEQLRYADETGQEFEQIYADARPYFLEIFERHPELPRPSIEEILQVFMQPGNVYWKMGADLCRPVCGQAPDESFVRSFEDACPPFRSLLTALFLTQHDRVIAERTNSELRKLAGRVDVFSALFLPYCDIFVSNDRDQLRFLRKVVGLIGGHTEVVWFRSFMDRIGLGAESRINVSTR